MNLEQTSQRDAFLQELYNQGHQNHDIVLLSADMGAPVLDAIRKDLPGQFLNLGIAEQNAILVASGLALEGKQAFTFAIASFMTINCLEKIRVQLGIQKIPVQVIGVGGGFSYADSGPTHHGIDDVASIRAIAGIEILSVSSGPNAKIAAEYSLSKKDQPRYIRLDREVLPHIKGVEEMSFEKGYRFLTKTSSENAILVTGNLVAEVYELAKKSAPELNVIEVGRLDKVSADLVKVLSGFKQITTFEEHFATGGLGSLIGESILKNGLSSRLHVKALDPASGYSYQYGGRRSLRMSMNLDIEAYFSNKEF